MKKINIIVVGASGKMGQAIIKETNEDSDLNLVMAVDIKLHQESVKMPEN